MALNKVMLIGNVGKDPEVRYLETPEHPKVVQFTLATTEKYKAKDGSVTEPDGVAQHRGMARAGGHRREIHPQRLAAVCRGKAAHEELGSTGRSDVLSHGDSRGRHSDARPEAEGRTGRPGTDTGAKDLGRTETAEGCRSSSEAGSAGLRNGRGNVRGSER